MRHTKLALAALSAAMAFGALVGCDNDGARQDEEAKKKPAAVTPPTTLPAAQVASYTTTKPATQPTASFLFLKEVPDPRKSQAEGVAQPAVDDPNDFGASFQFPRARMRLTGKGDSHLVALFYSDDPKEAISKNWQGDRYYFRMPLQTPDPKAIESFPYRSVVEMTGSDETSNGVFLKGDRFHLEPIDLSVRFEIQDGQVIVFLGGLFKQYDTTDVQAEPKWFHVRGMIPATIDKKD